MTNSIKAAFSGIRAEETLKTDTLLFLRSKMRGKARPRSFIAAKRLAACFVCLAAVVCGAFSHKVYYTERAYVDLDVNPSVELSVNGFDRVIGAYAYNEDGADVLGDVSVMHKYYGEAVGILIDETVRKGYAQDAELVSVTLQTSDEERESEMLTNIETAVLYRQPAAQISAFPVDGETRNAAHDVNLSPAKYLAIQELIEVDPTVNIESCREHSIPYIKRLTAEHSGGHGGSSGGGHGGPSQKGHGEGHGGGHGGGHN